MKLCSACLLGINCRYDGKNNLDDKLIELSKKEVLIPICPEQLGGLPTPRGGARITTGDGLFVINGDSRLSTDDGEDVTNQYVCGAQEALNIARLYGIKEAILKQGSPSCGCGYTQGGLDKRIKIEGDGVTVALFKKNGIVVKTEKDYLK